MDNLAFFDDVVEWEDSDEKIEINNSDVPRYAKLSELVDVLTMEGCPMNYMLLSVILLCLPSISSPMEFCQQLMEKFSHPNTRILPDSRREQIQMKILVTLRTWARHSSAYCDFSGPMLENTLDIVREAIANENQTVAAAGKKVRAALRVIRDDLRDIDKAQTIYRERVTKMTTLLSVREIEFEETFANQDRNQSVARLSPDVNQDQANMSSPSTPLTSPEKSRFRSVSEGSIMYDPSRESLASISLNESTRENLSIHQKLLTELISESWHGSDPHADCTVSTSKEHEDKSRSPSSGDDHGSKHMIRPSKPPTRRISIIKAMNYEQLCSCLTITECDDYMYSVRPREFIAMAWTKKALKSVHPDLGGSANLSRVIHYTNQKIAWVAKEIIDYACFFGPTAEAIEYFIRTARAALRVNNFNTFFQIIAALGLPAIRHLKAGWSLVATRMKALYGKYVEICSTKGNYAYYRKLLLDVCHLPHIPCLQILIKDIALLESSGPWRSGGKIDMKKAVTMRKLVSSYAKIDMDNSCPTYQVTIKTDKTFATAMSLSPSTSSLTSLSPSTITTSSSSNSVATTTTSSPSLTSLASPMPSSVNISSPIPQRSSPHAMRMEDSSTTQGNNVNGHTTFEHISNYSNHSNSNINSIHTTPEKSQRTTSLGESPDVIRSLNNEVSNTITSVNTITTNVNVSTNATSSSALTSTSTSTMGTHVNTHPTSISSPSGTSDTWTTCDSSTMPSFTYNCKVVRDPFFAPMHELHLWEHCQQSASSMGLLTTTDFQPSLHSIHDLSKINNISFSPNSNRTNSTNHHNNNNNNNNNGKRSGGRNLFRRLFSSFLSSKTKASMFQLSGEDEQLVYLQMHILNINPDLNVLWQDAKQADKIETKRLVGKLTIAGLY